MHPPGGLGGVSHPRMRYGIARPRGEVDATAVTDAWNRVMELSDYDGPTVWFHGDLAY